MNDTQLLEKRTLALLSAETSLPSYVFSGRWACHFFFDPFTLRAPEFADIKNILLDSDASEGVVLVNVDAYEEKKKYGLKQTTSLYLDRSTTPSEYFILMRDTYRHFEDLGPKGGVKIDYSPISWWNYLERYACSSEKNNWCIYAEQIEDVGVLAFRDKVLAERCSSAIIRLYATSIEDAAKTPPKMFFDFGVLVEEWRSGLLENYS